MSFTLESVETDLLDYADFEQVASVSRAHSFATAAERWLILAPKAASNQSSSMTMNPEMVTRKLNRAYAYIEANDKRSGASRQVGYFSVDGFRD